MKRHVLEILGAILLGLAAYFAYAVLAPISLPLSGTGSGVAPTSDVLTPALITIPKPRVRWPQFPNFCLGLCTNEEYLR